MTAATLPLRGELDIATLGRVRRSLTRAIAASGTEVLVVDLQAVTFLDAATVTELLRAQAEAHRSGVRVVLSGVSPKLARTLRLLDAESAFDILS